MGQVGKYLRRTGRSGGYTADGWAHYCPACRQLHHFSTDAPNYNGARWAFNGDAENPSFTPSMNIRWGNKCDPACDIEGGVCHYFLTSGKLHFLGDSTHALAGQTVPLPELPLQYTDRYMGTEHGD